jgi:transposase
MKRREFGKEFKLEAVALSNEPGVTISQAARDLGIRPALRYRWRAEMRSDGVEAFAGKGTNKASDEEIRLLRRELAQVRMGRDILKKRCGSLHDPQAKI